MTVADPLTWDIGVAAFSAYDSDGFLGVQYDAEGEGDSGVVPYEVHPVHGALHRPLDPEVDPASLAPVASQSATVLYAMEGGRGHLIVLGDPRTMANLPLLRKGETLLFSDFASFIREHDDGRISLFTTDDNTTSGQAVARTMGPSGFDDFAPWGRMAFDPMGFRVEYQPGASFHLSYLAGFMPGLSTLASLAADQIELDGSFVSIGPPTAQMPVAKVPPLLAVLTTIANALTAVGVDLSAIGGTTGYVPTAPALIAASVASIAGSSVAMSTQTVIG